MPFLFFGRFEPFFGDLGLWEGSDLCGEFSESFLTHLGRCCTPFATPLDVFLNVVGGSLIPAQIPLRKIT